MKIKKLFTIIIVAGALLLPIVSLAQGSILNPQLIAEAACTKNGTCTLNTFIKLGISVSNFILGIVGALTLVMFIFGGFTWVLSGGSSEQIKKGKDIILASIVGLLIVFSSYMIINFVTNDLLGAQGNFKFNGTVPLDAVKEDAKDTKKTATTSEECSKAGGSCKESCSGNENDLTKKACPSTQTCCKAKEVVTCQSANHFCVSGANDGEDCTGLSGCSGMIYKLDGCNVGQVCCSCKK